MKKIPNWLKGRIWQTCLASASRSGITRKAVSSLLLPIAGKTLLPLARMQDRAQTSGVLQPRFNTTTVSPARVGEAGDSIPVEFPDICFFEFQNVFIAANSSGLVQDNHLVLPNHLYDQRHRIIGNSTLARYYDAHSAIVPKLESQPIQSGIFLGGLGSFNWYHWLVEILPKTLFLQDLPEHTRNYPFLVPPEFADYQTYRQALDALGLKNEIIVLEKGQIYNIKEVIFIDTASVTPFNMQDGLWPELADSYNNSDVLHAFRERILNRLEITPSPRKRRIFLARSNARRNYNQSDLMAMLSAQDIETVYTDKLSFRDQVQLFQDAELIIGPSGASWSSLLFARPECIGLIWTFPQYSTVACYSNIAHAVRADLRYLFFPSTSAALTTHDLYQASYDMDLTMLRDVVNQFSRKLEQKREKHSFPNMRT
jgi:glycosyl transferase family 61